MQLTAPVQATPKAGQPSIQPVDFVRGSFEHTEKGPTATKTLTTAPQQAILTPVPAYGFLRSIVLKVTGTTAGNAATVAFDADGPWSVLGEVALTDPNGTALVQLDGYSLMLLNKYGGYQFDADPTRSPSYSAVTGAGDGVGGSFSFLLRVPVEIVARYAYGALPNMNAASGLQLKVTLAGSGDVYSTPPTAPPSVAVETFLECWAMPEPTDYKGRPVQQTPPELMTAQFWIKNIYDTVSGDNTVQLRRVGNLVRNIILVNRDNTGARSNSSFPATYRLELDSRPLYDEHRDLRRHYMQERFGYGAAALDTGVFVFTFNHDTDGHPGHEMRDLYLPTNSASRLELRGSFSTSGTLSVLTNDVVPAAGVA